MQHFKMGIKFSTLEFMIFYGPGSNSLLITCCVALLYYNNSVQQDSQQAYFIRAAKIGKQKEMAL